MRQFGYVLMKDVTHVKFGAYEMRRNLSEIFQLCPLSSRAELQNRALSVKWLCDQKKLHGFEKTYHDLPRYGWFPNWDDFKTPIGIIIMSPYSSGLVSVVIQLDLNEVVSTLRDLMYDLCKTRIKMRPFATVSMKIPMILSHIRRILGQIQ